MLGNFKSTYLLFEDEKQIDKRSVLYPEGCHLHGRDHNVYGFISQCFAFERLLFQRVVTLH